MILRKIGPNKFVQVKSVDPSEEEEFLTVNIGGEFIRVDDLPVSYSGIWIQDSNGNYIPDLDAEKKYYLQKLDKECTDYILSYYPDTKQKSDLFDKEYHAAALLMINSSYNSDQLYKLCGNFANEILDGMKTFEEILSTVPEIERFHWEQLIKVSVRTAWLQRVKYQYYQYKEKIMKCNSVDELHSITFNFLPFPKLS